MSTTQPDADLRAIAAARAADPSPHRVLWPRLFPYRPRPAAIRPDPDPRADADEVEPPRSDRRDPGL